MSADGKQRVLAALIFFLGGRRNSVTLEEASRRYGIAIEKLKLYEGKGLLQHQPDEEGIADYQEADFKRFGQIQVLEQSGMKPEDLQIFLGLSDKSTQGRAQRTKLLRKCRAGLLEEIHRKQQFLDRIDYYIYELKQASAESTGNVKK